MTIYRFEKGDKTMKNKTYTDLKNLIESRLLLQSTQRNLLVYSLNCKSFDDILSPKFIGRINKLPEFQRKSILINVAGPIYWRQLQEILEKINN